MKICPKHQSPALSLNWNTTGSVSETLKMFIHLMETFISEMLMQPWEWELCVSS